MNDIENKQSDNSEKMEENKAQLTCPLCQHKQTVDIPQAGCLAFFKCEQCEEIVAVPEGSKHCCVMGL